MVLWGFIGPKDLRTCGIRVALPFTVFFHYHKHCRVTGFSPESGQIFFGVTACLPRVSVCEWVRIVFRKSILIFSSWVYVRIGNTLLIPRANCTYHEILSDISRQERSVELLCTEDSDCFETDTVRSVVSGDGGPLLTFGNSGLGLWKT